MNMVRMRFDDTFHLADTMINLRDEIQSEGKYPLIVTCAKYDVAKNLLESLIMCGEAISIGVDLEDCEWSGYGKEFYISLSDEGVSVEKAWHEDNQWHEAGYLDCEGDVTFVHDECSSRIINHINTDKVYEFSIIDVEDEDYYDEYCNCDECRECCRVNEEISTTDNENFYVNGKPVTKDVFDKYEKDFRARIKKIKEIEDEMDRIRRMISAW